ncbi:MAG: GntR family transcriptional regulator [Capsulimonadaceae bacterium]|nr:GntR family transcriptional regulator [Capsulimonadaceae bacterium]
MLNINKTPRIPLLSLPDIIANALRDAIVRGDIAPGEALRQDDIALQFNASRIPVREALRRLQAEGLVALHSNKGAIVTMLSADDVRELFDIRLLLEPSALRFAIPRHDAETWAQASVLLDRLDREPDQHPLGDANTDFHLALYAPANRPHLLEMIKGLHRNTDRYGRQTQNMSSQQLQAQIEHRQILDACAKRDADLAATLLSAHIERFGHDLVAEIEKKDIS